MHIKLTSLIFLFLFYSPIHVFGHGAVQRASELKDSDGQFGFMVSPTPRIGLERAAEEIMRGFREIANRGAALAEVT